MVDLARAATLRRLHAVMSRINAGEELPDVLQAIVDGVVEVCGFQAATVNVAQPGGEFELLAVASTDPRLNDLLHHRYSAEDMLGRSRVGESWGMLRYVHHSIARDLPREGTHTLDFEPIDHPDAWYPEDELSVELHSPTGEVLGLMYVDHPRDGLRPSEETREILEMYAVQAGIAINHAQQRGRLREQVWLHGMVRSVVDSHNGSLTVEQCLDLTLTTLRTELSAKAAAYTRFPTSVASPASRGDDGVRTVSAALGTLDDLLAAHAYHRRQPLVLDRATLQRGHDLVSESRRGALLRAFETDDVRSLVLAPVVVDDQVIGQVVVLRRTDAVWTPAELSAVTDVVREISWSIARHDSNERQAATARALERSRQDRQDVLTSLTKSVTTPLSTIDQELSRLPADHPARRGLEGMWSIYHQMVALLELEDPDRPVQPEPVDLATLVRVQWPHLERLAGARGVGLLPLDAPSAQLAWADPQHLEWLVKVLLDDVLTHTGAGGKVRVSVGATPSHRVVISCQASPGSGGPSVPSQRPTWWRAGAAQLLDRQQAQLRDDTDPTGGRTLSISLPVPPVSART